MKKLIIILTIVITACNTQVSTKQEDKEFPTEKEHSESEVRLNKGSKWKADQATKENVAAMVKLVNDRSYMDAAKREELSAKLQSKIDTLIKQCRMQGPEHDALHVWLEKVLTDMKQLKDGENGYSAAYAALKKQIESFYLFFE